MFSTACSTNPCFLRPRSPGKERDQESGNDYFGARYYGSNGGRFLTPDFGGMIEGSPDPVPWATFRNPQTLNLYSYVTNNPLTRRDEDGHVQVCGNQYATMNGDGATVVHANCTEQPDSFFQTMVTAASNWHQNQLNQMNGPPQMQMDIVYPVDLGALESLGESIENILAKAESTVGNQSVRVANRQVAEQAAKEWVGEDAEAIPDTHGGKSGGQAGMKSAGGTKIARTTSAATKGYINLVNKATGGNLHVRW